MKIHATARCRPLPRLIRAVREHSESAEDLIALAFSLCEANLAIGRHEYPRWQGLSIFYAGCVFSVHGLGGDLCSRYG